MNYYNEFDKGAADTLRNLISAGLIPRGEVDSRSICDVSPSDLKGFTQHHFFAGIGGWSLALQLAGFPEDEPIWTGSCPCQPFSIIGEKRGTDDPRHLWPTWFELIKECRPARVVGEQVASSDALDWLDGVHTDMEGADYAFAASDLCAAGVGAPHIRQRLYWLGDAQFTGLEGHRGYGPAIGSTQAPGPDSSTGSGCVQSLQRAGTRGSPWDQYDALPCSDGWRRVRPGSFPLATRLSSRMARLHQIGNAIVPHLAAQFIRAAFPLLTRY